MDSLMILAFLTISVAVLFLMCLVLFIESIHEQEKRAIIIGFIGMCVPGFLLAIGRGGPLVQSRVTDCLFVGP